MPAIIILIFLIPVIVYIFKYTFSRIITNESNFLDSNAKIISHTTQADNWGKFKHFKTIVYFSDGSEYHTHYSRREPGFGYARVIVDAEVIAEIERRALIAHTKKARRVNIEKNLSSTDSNSKSLLDENELREIERTFPNYPAEFINEFSRWVDYWSTQNSSSLKHTTLEYLIAMNSCTSQYCSENALELCYKIFSNKLRFGHDNISHSFNQLDAVLLYPTDDEKKEFVVNGILGYLLACGIH